MKTPAPSRTLPLLTLILLCLPLFGLIGCGSGQTGLDRSVLSQWVGKRCTVQVRRDALGSAHTLPVAPLTDEINGAAVSISGTLERVDAHSIVLNHASKSHFIPEASILLIRLNE